MTETAHQRPTLVLGGTGKTGRRLVERLTRRHIPVRIGSRSAGLPLEWDQPSTPGPVFGDVEGAYTDVPDLVVSNPTDANAGAVGDSAGGGDPSAGAAVGTGRRAGRGLREDPHVLGRRLDHPGLAGAAGG